MNNAVYIIGIILQGAGGIIALHQVSRAPRKLPWLLIAVSALLIVYRRAATLGEFLSADRSLAAAELMTLLISLLFFVGVLLMSQMFNELNLARKKLFELATTDDLTGLNNRRHFLELASQEFARAKRYEEMLSLIMIDIDSFKTLNDTIGHSGGDALLREFGLKMKSFFRKTDIAGRLGGEEFAVLLPRLSLDNAFTVADCFREEIAQSKSIYEHQEINYTISLGVASYSSELENLDQLIKLADQGLYKAKHFGRNCTQIGP